MSEKENQASDERILSELESITKGMIFVSETDSEVSPFIMSKEEFYELGDLSARAIDEESEKIEQFDANSFLDKMKKTEEWFSRREIENSRKWKELKKFFRKNFNEIKGIKIGRVRKEIYLFAETESGKIVGVKMKSVET
jgi:hypothetical protein